MRAANPCARPWLGAEVGFPIAAAVPGLDRARLVAGMDKGREARFEQRTLCDPGFMAQ